MEIKTKKNHLSRIKLSFIMLLFAICLTTNVFFCSIYNLYQFPDTTTAIEPWTISESIDTNAGHDSTSYIINHSHPETITRNISSILIIAEIPKEMSLLLFLVIVYLFFFLTLFISLPDEWTLINQKVRLDN